MSPAARLFHARLERRAAALAPEVRRALFRAYARLRLSITEAQLEAFVRSPSAERLLEQAITEAEIERAFAPVSRTLRDGVEQAAQAITRELPKAVGISFNVLNPAIVDAIRQLDTRVVGAMREDVRETVRAYVEQGLREGVNPRDMARNLRATIGLAPNQVQAVANFERMLREGDLEALTRALRDRRFDATLRKAFAGEGLSEAQIQKMTTAYRQRMTAFHAETITRTAALDAQRLGQHLTWQSAVERGDIDGSRLTKRWSGTLDDRERPTHLAMEGETVPWDQPYSNGQMTPGDSEYNCRCVSIYETSGKVKVGAGAEAGLFPDVPIGPRNRAAELDALRQAARTRRRGAA